MQDLNMLRPPVNRATKVVNRVLFEKDIQISAGRISDIKNIWRVRKDVYKSDALLNVRNVGPIQPDPRPGTDQSSKCLLLAPAIHYQGSINLLPYYRRETISKTDNEPKLDRSTWNATITRLVDDGDLSLFPFDLRLDYDNWTAHDILLAILPENLLDDIPTSFSRVGHVIHLNLREEYLPYKRVIAQVLMDKNPGVRTVINKRDNLSKDNIFRVSEYELLVGEEDLLVEVKEENCTYRFDLSKVFWNMRQGTEHKRVVDMFEAGQAVCDVMAGVGPFAIPAGKKGVFVWANDLNEHCYDALRTAVSINKVSEFVKPFNEDGHFFIKQATSMLLQDDVVAKVPLRVSRHEALTRRAGAEDMFKRVHSPKVFSHYVMNLPGSAIEFLPNFVGLYAGKEYLFQPYTDLPLPTIHCYCFCSRNEEQASVLPAELQICNRVSEQIGFSLRPNLPGVAIAEVRDVAPNKMQYRISFTLPKEVAFRNR